MPAAMNKANQRQSQKRKKHPKAGLRKIRMHFIPMICPRCGQNYDLSSAETYKKGGNICRRCAGMSYQTVKLPNGRLTLKFLPDNAYLQMNTKKFENKLKMK